MYLCCSKRIVESNDRKKELNDLVKKRHLKEREELTMQLQDTHEIIRQKDVKISVRASTCICMIYRSSSVYFYLTHC